MYTVKFDRGVEVHLPDNFEIFSEPKDAATRLRRMPQQFPGAIPMPQTATETVEQDAVIRALRDAEMEVVQTVVIAPKSQDSSKTRMAQPTHPAELVVDLTYDEEAVVLIEQDGMYLWKYPDESEDFSGTRKRGENIEAFQKRLRFRIDINPEPGSEATTRNIFGKILEFGINPIKTYILKFIARHAVNSALSLIEKDITPKLVKLKTTDPGEWYEIDNMKNLDLQSVPQPPRILLFVHGTFSSTIGAFGALGTMPWGIEFLQSCIENYDAVLGFDHLTLREDPLENAQQLLNLLSEYEGDELLIDIITHSRGALVVRTLIEKLLPESGKSVFKINRVVFAASTNEGTLLAQPVNWEKLIDLYTNLAAGTSRVIGMVAPQAKIVTTILSEVIKNLGSFVKYCAISAIKDRLVPGLAAMDPSGDFIKDMNLIQAGQPGIDNSYYCIITSDFKPSLMGDHEPRELPKRLLSLIAGGFINQLIKESNDLVVNTSSMGAIDLKYGNFIKDKFEFGVNAQVYHTNYFTRPEVTNVLTRWLKLTSAKPKSPTKSASRNIGNKIRIILPELPVSAINKNLTVNADSDIMLFDTQDQVQDLGAKMIKHAPSYVVLRREYNGHKLNYAFKGEEVLDMINNYNQPGSSVLDAFNLHEINSSGEETITGTTIKDIQINTNMPSEYRKVVIDDDTPIGVIDKVKLPDAFQLAAMAKEIDQNDTRSQILRRRIMPSFTNMGTQTDVKVKPKQQQQEDETGPAEPPVPIFYMHAEMNPEIKTGKTVDLVVTVSRDIIEKVSTEVSQKGTFLADTNKRLIISVIAKKNVEIVDESGGRAEIDLPGKEPEEIYFSVKGTEVGQGELWVIARQGQVPLLKLILRPQIAAAPDLDTQKISLSADAIPQEGLIYPRNQLWVEEVNTFEGVIYRYTVFFQGVRVTQRLVSKPIKGNRETYISELYETIEKRWISSMKDSEKFQQELRAFGAELFDELIPAELQKTLWDKRNDFDSIQVVSSEPFIPWELIHLKDPAKKGMPDEVKFLGQMGLVRWLEGAGKDGWAPEEIKLRTGMVKYVIPDYPHPDYKLPQAQLEKKYLENKFQATAINPDSADVRDCISKPGQFDVLHFACHGAAESNNITNACLLMAGRVEDNKYITDLFTETTAKTFSDLVAEDNTPMVVLNACQVGKLGYKLTGIGGFANAFLSAGAGAFVGALWSVDDGSARIFTQTLYEALTTGDKNLAEAATEARETARQAKEATWLAYVVYGNPNLKINCM